MQGGCWRKLLATCIARARCWRSCAHCRSLVLEKAMHAAEACQGFSTRIRNKVLFLLHCLFSILYEQSLTSWQLSEGNIFKWPKSIFAELTKTVNLDLRSNNWLLEQSVFLTTWILYTPFYTHFNCRPTTVQLYFYLTRYSYSNKRRSFHLFPRMNRWTVPRVIVFIAGYINYLINCQSYWIFSYIKIKL